MMRFLVTTMLFSTIVFATFTVKAESTAAEALQQKLQQIDTFSAHFTQQVFDQQRQVLQQAEGELNLKQPQLFRFETTVPENNIFIGDGQSLWFYSAELEQLTIYDAAAEVNRTPFVLLTSKEPALWANFNVKQQQQQFIISAKDSSSQVTELILIFSQAALSEMRVLDINQQLSVFKFNAVQINIPIANSLFNFLPPEFTEIDDQRSRN